MNDDAIKAAEKRGYARGYQAGKGRRKADADREQRRKADQAFLERAFIAALPACIQVQGWSRGDAPIKSLPDKTRLAWDFAEEALKQRRRAK